MLVVLHHHSVRASSEGFRSPVFGRTLIHPSIDDEDAIDLDADAVISGSDEGVDASRERELACPPG
jgi:hypothetical protein